MWYILYSPNVGEKELLNSCKQHISKEILKDAFIFTYERMKRYEGQWHTEILPLFPNYVFLESNCEDEARLSKELEQYRDIVKVMEDKEILWKVYPGEEMFLRCLCGEKHHIRMSRGYIRNGVTFVEEGPLKGQEKYIRKIDRHKRLAWVVKPDTNKLLEKIQVGLEIVGKS